VSSTNLVGQTLGGRYQIESLIGQGGMASVYKAYDLNLRRAVAIKVIHPHLSNNPKFFHRFEEEATAVAQLRHPNIVLIYDFSHEEDLYYMVMEFVRGETLQNRLQGLHEAGRRLRVKDAITYTAEICDAADYAHKRGMIHRDIKPANIMLDIDGKAILMDFGIAHLVGASQHTATGAVLGTAMYMSPEQIHGIKIDARSDIYSIGVTFFEMLSGSPPFNAESAMTLMMMHLNFPIPDMHDIQPDLPAELIGITHKALAKNRDERFQTAHEMADALRRLPERALDTQKVLSKAPAEDTLIEISNLKDLGETLVETEGSLTPGLTNYPSTMIESPVEPIEHIAESTAEAILEKTPVERKKTKSWIIISFLLLMIGAGGYLAYTRFHPNHELFSLVPSPTVQTSLLSFTPMTTPAALEVTPTLQLIAQQTATSVVENHIPPSPTSTSIIADYKNPHGKIVYTCEIFRDPERYQICMINADGTGFTQLTNESNNYYPSLAPDGKSVIFVSYRTGQWQIYELELSTGGLKQITYGNEEWAAPDISPDGKSIVAAKNTHDILEIWIMDRNGEDQSPLVQMNTDCLDPAWSADGENMLFACGPASGRQLYTIGLKDKEIHQITDLPQIRGRSDWSPDQNEIASYIGGEWEREIVIIGISGNIIKYLTDGGNNLAPSYSPDGAWITFTSYKDHYREVEGCEIYILKNDGSDVRRLTNNNYCDWQPRWGP
jgi:serine/threonine protein kinase